MLDLTRVPPRGAPREAHEQYLSDFMAAMDEGLEALRAVASGAPPNIAALDGYAQALEALRIGSVSDGGVRPVEDDVQAARRLFELARANAPREELVELARVLRMTADERTRVAGSADESPDRGRQIAEALTEGFACCREVVSALKASAQVPDPKWIEKLQAMDEAFSAISAGELGRTTAVTPERLHRVRRLRSLVALWVESGRAPEGMQALAEGLFTAFPPPTS